MMIQDLSEDLVHELTKPLLLSDFGVLPQAIRSVLPEAIRTVSLLVHAPHLGKPSKCIIHLKEPSRDSPVPLALSWTRSTCVTDKAIQGNTADA